MTARSNESEISELEGGSFRSSAEVSTLGGLGKVASDFFNQAVRNSASSQSDDKWEPAINDYTVSVLRAQEQAFIEGRPEGLEHYRRQMQRWVLNRAHTVQRGDVFVAVCNSIQGLVWETTEGFLNDPDSIPDQLLAEYQIEGLTIEQIRQHFVTKLGYLRDSFINMIETAVSEIEVEQEDGAGILVLATSRSIKSELHKTALDSKAGNKKFNVILPDSQELPDGSESPKSAQGRVNWLILNILNKTGGNLVERLISQANLDETERLTLEVIRGCKAKVDAIIAGCTELDMAYYALGIHIVHQKYTEAQIAEQDLNQLIYEELEAHLGVKIYSPMIATANKAVRTLAQRRMPQTPPPDNNGPGADSKSDSAEATDGTGANASQQNNDDLSAYAGSAAA